jgi:hypothetical protein
VLPTKKAIENLVSEDLILFRTTRAQYFMMMVMELPSTKKRSVWCEISRK